MRSVVVVAGLALGLMSGAAKAAVIDVNFAQGAGNTFAELTGTIVTDVNSGVVGSNDFESFNLTLSDSQGGSASFTNANSSIGSGGNDLQIVAGKLIFTFSGDGNSFEAQNSPLTGRFSFFAGGPESPSVLFNTSNVDNNQDYIAGSSVVIGTVSAVPLPASAPMFGAALIALGAAGYGMKRKAASAT